MNNIKDKVSLREELILLTLTKRELYGLEIVRAIKEASYGTQNIRVGTLYPTLHNLEQKGFVISRWGDDKPDERGRARRQYYRLTDTGTQAIESIISFRNNLLAWQP